MILWLTEAQAHALVQHARMGAPNEVCGLIGGTGYQAQRIIPVANVAADPRQRYEMDPRALVEATFGLESEGLSVIGFYHSHPDGDPIPSATDVRQALYPDTAYLIVGLHQNEAQLAAWRIRHGQVTPVQIHVGDQPATTPAIDDGEMGLSRAQIAAIVTSAVLALVLMLVLSLSLLPPAPSIPAR